MNMISYIHYVIYINYNYISLEIRQFLPIFCEDYFRDRLGSNVTLCVILKKSATCELLQSLSALEVCKL